MGREGGECGVSSITNGTISGPSVVGRLQEALRERIVDAVGSVFGAFGPELAQPHVGTLSFDTYKTCCQQLVTYMETYMETSTGFAQQMERVIAASHNDAAEETLRSLVQEDMWVRYSSAEPEESTDRDRQLTPIITETEVAAESTAQTPCVDLTKATPPTVTRGGKRPISGGNSVVFQNLKRARHAVVRVLYDAEEGRDQDGVENSLGSETETETEDGVLGRRNEGNDSCPWPCATDKPLIRSALFKHRLRKALLLVDAENCKPPPEMVCGQGCVSLQAQMCAEHKGSLGDATPCHDSKCSMWIDVDTHTVRCHSSQCEFKNRVGLRKTLHVIQQRKLRLGAITANLNRTKSRLREMLMDGTSSGSFATTALKNIVEKLEKESAKIGDSIVFQSEREQAFRDDLNAIGICVGNDETDSLPCFMSHYVKRGHTS